MKKNIKKKNVYMCITESLYSNKHNIVIQLYFN